MAQDIVLEIIVKYGPCDSIRIKEEYLKIRPRSNISVQRDLRRLRNGKFIYTDDTVSPYVHYTPEQWLEEKDTLYPTSFARTNSKEFDQLELRRPRVEKIEEELN